MIHDLLAIGHASWDITMAVSHHPTADEKMVAESLQLSGGGPAANAAVTVTRLGGSAAFCGYLGDDLFGEAHRQELLAEGVNLTALVQGAYPTPLSQILATPDGLRSLVNYKGNRGYLAANAVAHLPPAKVILFDGHEPALSLSSLSWAKQNGRKTVLDAGSLHRGTALLAGKVDYLLASSRFASQQCETDDMQLALQQLAKISPHVVITLGAEGLIWSSANQQGEMAALTIQAVDSTGAGDAFHGAFALGLARDMEWFHLLSYASAAAALTCTRLGARPALPDAEAVQELLKESDQLEKRKYP
ncbi:MAG: PfkB family carbohydrate kinase [Mariprofundus sp.]|nr:PfkB family carbohydrate kinase [Mariprofundus sp.]